MSIEASTAPSMQCPVCRARQPFQSPCRRCDADLSLYVLALQSLGFAEREFANTYATDPSQFDANHRQRWREYLRWLKPIGAPEQSAVQFILLSKVDQHDAQASE